MDWENTEERMAFLLCMKALGQLHNREISAELSKMYFMALAEFSIEQVKWAMAKNMGESRFFPKPVEIREVILGPQISLENIAEVEAGKVLQAMKDVGSHRSVCFDDAVTMAVIRSGFGGWVQLCSENKITDEKWFRKDFVRTYVAYAHGGVKHYGGLAGQLSITNNANGNADEDDTVFIGNADKARELMEAEEYSILGGSALTPLQLQAR